MRSFNFIFCWEKHLTEFCIKICLDIVWISFSYFRFQIIETQLHHVLFCCSRELFHALHGYNSQQEESQSSYQSAWFLVTDLGNKEFVFISSLFLSQREYCMIILTRLCTQKQTPLRTVQIVTLWKISQMNSLRAFKYKAQKQPFWIWSSNVSFPKLKTVGSSHSFTFILFR